MAHDFALIMELKLWHMVLLLGAPHALQHDVGIQVTAHGFASGSTTNLQRDNGDGTVLQSDQVRAPLFIKKNLLQAYILFFLSSSYNRPSQHRDKRTFGTVIIRSNKSVKIARNLSRL